MISCSDNFCCKVTMELDSAWHKLLHLLDFGNGWSDKRLNGVMLMKNKVKNVSYLITSKGISKIGDILFDFANNTFLASLNPTSLSMVAIYQSLESVIGVLFNLYGGVIADNFKRKKLLLELMS